MATITIESFVEHHPLRSFARLSDFDDYIRKLAALGYGSRGIAHYLALNDIKVSESGLRKYIAKNGYTPDSKAKDAPSPVVASVTASRPQDPAPVVSSTPAPETPSVTPRPHASALPPFRHRWPSAEAALTGQAPSLDSATGGSAMPDEGPTREEFPLQTAEAPARLEPLPPAPITATQDGASPVLANPEKGPTPIEPLTPTPAAPAPTTLPPLIVPKGPERLRPLKFLAGSSGHLK